MKLPLFLIFATIATFTSVSAQKFAVLSDIHVTPGNRCDSALTAAVREINTLNLDAVIVCGDLTNQGDDAELLNVKSKLDSITHPLYVIPGNHENNWSESCGTTFPRLWQGTTFFDVIDSTVIAGINCGPFMKMGDGHANTDELLMLDRELGRLVVPGRRVVSFNHYPIRENDLDNWQQYLDILQKYPTVIHINGHYHHWMQYTLGDIPGVMVRALQMKDGSLGYSLVYINQDTAVFYEKLLSEVPTLMYTISLKHPESIEVSIPSPDIKPLVKEDASIFTIPVVAGDTVFYGTSTGLIKAINATDGTLLWTSEPIGMAIFGRPTVLKDRVAVPATKGICILDIKTGKQTDYITSPANKPSVADGAVLGDYYYQGGHGYFLRSDIGLSNIAVITDSIQGYCQAAPVISPDGKNIVFGCWDTHLYCIDSGTGNIKWLWENGKTNRLLSPGNVVPAVTDSTVYIVAPDRFMTAIDLETGETLWRDNSHRFRESMGVSEDASSIYAKTMDGELVAIKDNRNGYEEIWLTNMGMGYDHAPCPIIEVNEKIYVGSRRGIVCILDSNDGRVIKTYTLGTGEINGFVKNPSSDSIIVTLVDGTIFSLPL
ncbi:MAG: PQQ-binding-like beta-propeller repeat protein [Muribaculaceae bacterium]|nr:PQQ-binding-like beta-propeller repeat protein [Muribaculaceae bacterium]